MSSPRASAPIHPVPRGREVYCNRTLNLRAIKAIGYDMDYTLIHYKVDAWEQRAYAYLRQKLEDAGWPVADLDYDPQFAVRGLVIDTALGNLVKADRFGYIRLASHGTRRLPFEEQRRVYSRELVELGEPRWLFLNTFFSLSEACMYAQLVDRFDAHRFGDVVGYADLWRQVHRALDEAHAEGRLKAETVADPDRYVEADPDVALALLDQKASGKRLLLVTNSDWEYTRQVMEACLEPQLPRGTKWRELFELVVVSAHKPTFFSHVAPAFEVVNDDGLLRPVTGPLRRAGVYVNGSATLVERYLGLSGAEILYVGDHLYVDVRVTKDVLRWRTALLVRELERELNESVAAAADQARLDALMAEKAALEFEHAQARLELQRLQQRYGPPPASTAAALDARVGELRGRLERLDQEIAPIATSLGRLFNPIWGPLMRTGGEKSHLAWQVERYADIYTSRVSNFLYQTPFAYLRPPRGTLPHEVGD
jgi:5'-nucleotidase